MCIYIFYYFGSYVKIYNYIIDLKGIIELFSVKVYVECGWLDIDRIGLLKEYIIWKFNVFFIFKRCGL